MTTQTKTSSPPCQQAPDLFYPSFSGYWPENRQAEARKICSMCPYRDPCLDKAIQNREEFGIWGGTTPNERGTIRLSWSRSLVPLLKDLSPVVDDVVSEMIVGHETSLLNL